MPAVNPFIGIRAFLETDFYRFHGRKADSVELISKIQRYKITVLTGPSGYGKSSLVNCGVVKPMKKGRLEKKEGFAPQPFVIRDWGTVRGDTASDENIGLQFAKILKLQALQGFSSDAVGDPKYADRITAERDAFLKTFTALESDLEKDPYAFIDLAKELSDAFNGIVLVFDQFEEILRVGPEVVREVSNLVVQLTSVPGVKVMLSLRNEYLDALRIIEKDAGPLAQSTHHLTGMSFGDAKNVFLKMAHGPGETPNVDLKPELLELLRREGTGDADLFYFQAILSQIWQALNDSEQSTKVLNVSSLTALGADIGADAKKAFEYALLRIVNGCFPPGGEDRNLSLRCRSHAIRVAPWLSSGGFKTTQGEDDLFDKAYGDAMNSAADRPLEEITSGTFQNDHGKAIGTYDQVRDILKKEYKATLKRLEEGKILKRYSGAKGSDFWELTHDRLGDPLFAWSRDQINCLSDNRSASLASWGVTPIRVDKHQSTNAAHESGTVELSRASDWRKLNWRGCSLEPGRKLLPDHAGAKPKARFREIEFSECDFRGSVFVNCIFEKCVFAACHLSGSAFIDCTFNECQFRDLTDGRGASIGFFGCEFENGVAFSDCELIQFTIAKKGTKVDASGIVFRGCEIRSSRFSDRDPKTSAGRITLEGGDESLNWFEPASKWRAN